jgi:hypothetical protein
MKTLVLSSALLLCGFAVFCQDPAQPSETAPPEVDQALRARITKFYDAFIAGKFKEAYALVADESQDKFFELDKNQYKSCEVDAIQYSEHLTKAAVTTKCKGEWRLQGRVFPMTFPVRSNWELEDGQWYWHYVRPTMVQSPFSPSGWVPVPPENKDGSAPILPKDIGAVAQGILTKVAVDKSSVRFALNQASQDAVHLRNDMPGEVRVKIQDPAFPGLKITLGQNKLQAHEQTTIVFEWSPGAAKTTGNVSVPVLIEPTNQLFPITVSIDNTPSGGNVPASQGAAPQALAPPQK